MEFLLEECYFLYKTFFPLELRKSKKLQNQVPGTVLLKNLFWKISSAKYRKLSNILFFKFQIY